MGINWLKQITNREQPKKKYLADIIGDFRSSIKRCTGEDLTIHVVFNSITHAQNFIKVGKEHTPYRISEGPFKHVVSISFNSYAARYTILSNMDKLGIPIGILYWRKKTCQKSSYPMTNWLSKP